MERLAFWILLEVVCVAVITSPARAVGDESLESLVKDLTSFSSEQATRAAYALGRMGPDAQPAIPALIESLRDDRPQSDALVPFMPTVGTAAAEALTAIGLPAVEPLVKMLDDADDSVQLRAISALVGMKAVASTAEPKLRRLADEDDDSTVRLNALNAVPQISARRPGEVVSFLMRFLNHDEPEMRGLAMKWLATCGNAAEPAIPGLIDALKDESWVWKGFADVGWQEPLRLDAADALGQLGSAAQPALPALRRMMRDDEDVLARVAAAFAVARIDQQDAPSVEYLVSLLKADDPQTPSVHLALSHLAELPTRGQRAVPNVVVLTHSSEPGLRCKALHALRALIGNKSLEPLTAALEDPDELVRETAAHELGELGPAAATAVDGLIEVLQSDENWLYASEAAAKALVAIGTPRDKVVHALRDALGAEATIESNFTMYVAALQAMSATDIAITTLNRLAADSDDADVRDWSATELARLAKESAEPSTKSETE